MKWFRIKRSNKAPLAPTFSLAGKWIEARQRKGADVLNAHVRKMSPIQRWCWFGFVCLCLGGGSLYCIVAGMQKHPPEKGPDRITVPAFVTVPDQSDDRWTYVFAAAEIHHLLIVEKYIDSLRDHHSPIYDSIVSKSPHFEEDYLRLKQVLKQYKSK